MSTVCNCPRAESIDTIPISTCPESFGQTQKALIQRIYKADGTKNGFTMPSTDPKLKATWTARIAASDSTKVVLSPYIQAPSAEGGAARKFGGGNETLGGKEEIIGREPTPFTGIFRKVKQTIIATIKKLQCEEIGVYLINENGQIKCKVVGTVGSGSEIYQPIPINAFFVADQTLGGLETPDGNAISWQFMPNWSDDTAIITPTDFNPLSDLDSVVES